MQTREVVTDVQETLQLDMSPIAKEWKENPPLEIPIDSSTPKRFAGRLPSTRVLGDADSEPGPSQPSGSKAAVVDDTATVGEDQGADVCPEGDEPLVCGDGPGDKSPVPDDLFHSTAVVTRKSQYQERDDLENEKKRKIGTSEANDPEEGRPETKMEKLAAAKELKKQQKLAKAAAKKATAKAKKELAQKKKADAKAKAMAKKKEKDEKLKAEKAEKAAKAKNSKSKAEPKGKTEGGKAAKKKKVENQVEKENIPHAEDNGEPVAMPEVEPVPPVVAGPPEPASANADARSDAADHGENTARKKTFARRYRPARGDAVARFDSIKETFNSNFTGRFWSASMMEAWPGDIPDFCLVSWFSLALMYSKSFIITCHVSCRYGKTLENSIPLSFWYLVLYILLAFWQVEWWNHCMKSLKIETKQAYTINYIEFFQSCVLSFEDQPGVKCTFTTISHKRDLFCRWHVGCWYRCFLSFKPPLMYVEFHLLGTGQLRPNEMSLYRHNDDMDVDFRGWLA